MKPIRTLALILALCGTSLAATSQGGTGPGARVGQPRPAPQASQATGMTLKEVREAFTKADADRSGALSVDEAAFGGLDASGFTAGDADGDSKLSLDEYVVASESRVAKLSGGAASDLTAESTRVQALRRAQKAEAQKAEAQRARRDAPAAPAIGGVPARPAGAEPAPGPAGARRALAPAAPAAPNAATAESDDPRTLQEIRASIVRRLRNGEISDEKARVELEAIDRRIANATKKAANPAPVAGDATANAAPADTKIDLRSVEASLNKRIRNSDLEGDKAVETYQNTLRRIENARGATPPPVAAARQPGDPAATDPAPAPPQAQGFRAKIAQAQGDLTRRMRNAELTPEQAAAERAAQAKRIRGAAESLSNGKAPADSAPAAQPVPPPASDAARPPRTADGAGPAPANAPANAPARAPARTDAPPAAPAPAVNPPARRSDTPAAPAPAPAPARPQRPAPAAQPTPNSPAPAPAPADRGTPKPARPAPASGGGGR